MHFALPPRKTSSPPLYARASAKSAADRRRQQIQYLSCAVLCALTLYLLYSWVSFIPVARHDESIPEDSVVLIVTVFDEATMSEDYMTMVKANREDYATRHGYKTFYTNTSTYKSLYDSAPAGWATVPAVRNALTLHPEADYLWSLSPHAIITNVTLDLHSHIFKPLPTLMLKDLPVVPPDSVIHTFSHITPSTAYLILSQDMENLAHTSFILRNTLRTPQPPNRPKDTWAYFFLDAWFDPLYRAYAFQKAENHALEHIVQWHPTILANLVLIDQRRLNSYNFQYPRTTRAGSKQVDSMWREGDLLVNLKGCEESDQRDCEKEMRGYFEQWRREVERVDGKPVHVQLKIPSSQYVPQGRVKESGPSEYEKARTHI